MTSADSQTRLEDFILQVLGWLELYIFLTRVLDDFGAAVGHKPLV